MITPTQEPVLREIHTAPVTEEDWLPRLAHDIVSEHRQAQESAQTAVAHARRAGELLVQAKHRVVKHGEWAAWCEAELPFGERMAQRYMKVARELPRLPAQQAEQISKLSLRDALKMLSEPKEPRNGKTDPPKNKELEPNPTRVSDLQPDNGAQPKPATPKKCERRRKPVDPRALVEAALSNIFDDVDGGEDCGLWEAWEMTREADKSEVLRDIDSRIKRLVELHRRLSGEK